MINVTILNPLKTDSKLKNLCAKFQISQQITDHADQKIYFNNDNKVLDFNQSHEPEACTMQKVGINFKYLLTTILNFLDVNFF